MYSFETKNIIISNMNDIEFYDRQSFHDILIMIQDARTKKLQKQLITDK